MIKPSEYSDTQALGVTDGIDDISFNALTPNASIGDIVNDILDPIQQKYSGENVFLDSGMWQAMLNGTRQRPYLDVQIFPNSNAVRLPVVNKDYDLFADMGKFYEHLEVDGDLSIGGEITSDFKVQGAMRFSRFVDEKTSNHTIELDDKSKIIHIKPSGAYVELFLPSSGLEEGFFFEVVNLEEGKYTKISPMQGTLQAKGNGLSQKYSAATVYWTGTHWHAIGDLTPTV
jgi:hypothetical protein